MWRYSPLILGDWLRGQGLTSGSNGYQSGPDDYERWANIFAKSSTAKIVLEATDDYSSFYAVEADLVKLIPRAELLEAFYSMKLGFCAPGVPSQFLYVAKQIWKQYNVCSLIAPLLPIGLQFSLGHAGYFGNQYTGLDVYRTFFGENLDVISTDRMLVKCGDWYEAYLPSLDMIAALPECIGSRLKQEDLPNVIQKAGVGLVIGNSPLTAIGGLKGVCDSVFDLRRAL